MTKKTKEKFELFEAIIQKNFFEILNSLNDLN